MAMGTDADKTQRMQFNIDGRFLAELRWENDAWTVSPAKTGVLPDARDVAVFAGREANDIASYLDDIFLESGSDEPESPACTE